MNAVQQAVNAGKIVTVHTDMITYGEWEGFGYIVTTPETGGAAYMISGGLNGGSSDGLVSLAYMVDIGFSIVDIVEAFSNDSYHAWSVFNGRSIWYNSRYIGSSSHCNNGCFCRNGLCQFYTIDVQICER